MSGKHDAITMFARRRTDGRYECRVSYLDEDGEKRKKSFY